MKELTYFNGEFVEPGAKCVSLDDRGYCFGDGVYEVTRVFDGRCFAFRTIRTDSIAPCASWIFR